MHDKQRLFERTKQQRISRTYSRRGNMRFNKNVSRPQLHEMYYKMVRDTERKPNVEKGQIRETDSHKWLVRSVSTNRDLCGIVSETGVIWYIPTDIVDTWEIVTDETEEMFYNRITHDFSNILKEINKEYECLYFTANGWVDQ